MLMGCFGALLILLLSNSEARAERPVYAASKEMTGAGRQGCCPRSGESHPPGPLPIRVACIIPSLPEARRVLRARLPGPLRSFCRVEPLPVHFLGHRSSRIASPQSQPPRVAGCHGVLVARRALGVGLGLLISGAQCVPRVGALPPPPRPRPRPRPQEAQWGRLWLERSGRRWGALGAPPPPWSLPFPPRAASQPLRPGAAGRAGGAPPRTLGGRKGDAARTPGSRPDPAGPADPRDPSPG